MRVKTAVFKLVRVRNAATEDLDPTRALADAAALSPADGAGNVHLCGRLREREVARAETRAHILAEHGMHERIERAFQVRKRDVAIHHKALHLHEHRAVARIHLIHAEHAAGHDEPERRFERHERARLTGGSVRTQHHAVVDIEGILHVARRMVERQVQLREVVIVILHLRTTKRGEAHANERVADLAICPCHRMQVAGRQPALAGFRHIKRFLFKAAFEHQLRDLFAPHADGFLQLLLHGIRCLAELCALLLIKLAHGAQNLRQRTVAAQHGNVERVELFLVPHFLQAVKRFLPDLLQCVDHNEMNLRKI